MANKNVLEGFRCPSCGYQDSFDIECSGVATVTDEGIESAADADLGWQPESFIRCNNCGEEGEVTVFMAAGRDHPEVFEGEIQIGPVDLDMLKEQKQAINDAIDDQDEDSLLVGVLEFLDHIEDQIRLQIGYSVQYVCARCGRSTLNK